jgi:putative transposase
MKEAAAAWKVDFVAWTVMEHHYHAILRLQEGRSLPRFIGRLHTKTATFINREDNAPGRRVWRQYWDTLIHTEGDFWSRVNSVWWNPVRHGFCAIPEEWSWTNLRPLMSEVDEQSHAALQRFPAPRKLPGDEW